MSIPVDPSLELMLLGGLEVRLNGLPVAGVSYSRMRALLAYLAMEGEKDHSREYLAELLWGGNDPETARGNLRRTLADLRKALESPSGKTLFAASKHAIRFIPDMRLDVQDFLAASTSCSAAAPSAECGSCFAQMEQAASLYRGEFMAGFALPDCPDFEEWLLVQRETHRRRILALLEKLADCHERAGDYGQALRSALRHVELESWDEGAHRRAMRLYALNGQRGAAMAQYEACRHLLKKELDVLPSEETRQLAERIHSGELRQESFDRLRTNGMREATPQTIPQAKAERRQVTVLYCELHAEADDPEEAMELLHAPQARCVDIIRRFSGHIVQTHGGGLLAYFGYPQVSEHAARRAVQAALAVTREAFPGIEVRAGVHTGVIITGGEGSMPDISGRTSRLAIQLRHGVARNEVAISAQTQAIAGWYFDCARQGAQSLPGMAQPVEVFRVSRESGAHTRVEAAAQLTPFTGREAEIAELMASWEKAARGQRQIVLVHGEAGIGKSRLLHALKEKLRGQPHAVRELRCFPEFSQSPFYPMIAALEDIFGFAPQDTPELKSGKLVEYLETRYPALAQEAAPLLALLLSLPLPERYPAPDSTPQKQKERTIAILLRLLHALAAQQPVLFIVEDLHWIDPSSLELLTLFVGQQENGPVLALFTARPEFVPPWEAVLNTALALTPLVTDEAAKIVAAISGDIPEATLRRIVERADGVPLFVEEMARMATPDNQASIPATLHDLLAARLDTLSEAKRTAQLAATIGREFDFELLREIGASEPELDALQKAGLVLRRGAGYQFKHALIQDAAYQSQTKADRQAAHRRIAEALQARLAGTQPEILAQHWAACGENRQAIECWIEAGKHATQYSASAEAVAHFRAGLELIPLLQPGTQRDQIEFALQTGLSVALQTTRGHGSKEATAANARAAELSSQMEDSPELFRGQWAQVMNATACGGPHAAAGPARLLLEAANKHGDPLRKQAAHQILTDVTFWLGDFEAVRTHAEQALSLYHPDQHQQHLAQFDGDLSIFCMAYLAWSSFFLGYPDRAQQINERLLQHARGLDHPHTLALAFSFSSILHRWLGMPAATLPVSAESIAVSQEHGFPVSLAAGEMTHGWALARLGQEEQGIAELKSSIARMNAAISKISIIFLSALIETYAYLHLPDEALDMIGKALEEAARTGDSHFTAELYRLKGECLLEKSGANKENAQECFRQALETSRGQNAKSLELRAAMSLARHFDRKNLLSEVYGWFSEGFDTRDLREARHLLDALCQNNE